MCYYLIDINTCSVIERSSNRKDLEELVQDFIDRDYLEQDRYLIAYDPE